MLVNEHLYNIYRDFQFITLVALILIIEFENVAVHVLYYVTGSYKLNTTHIHILLSSLL